MNKIKLSDVNTARMKVFVSQFNQLLLSKEVIFKIEINENFDCFDIKPLSDKYVHSCIINVTDDGLAWIRGYFRALGYKVTFNNTASCFWLTEIVEEVAS